MRTIMPIHQSWDSEISPDFFLTVVLTHVVCYPVTNKASKSMNAMGNGLRTWWIVKIWQEAGKFSFSHLCMQNSNSIKSEGNISTQVPTDTKQFFKYFTGHDSTEINDQTPLAYKPTLTPFSSSNLHLLKSSGRTEPFICICVWWQQGRGH